MNDYVQDGAEHAETFRDIGRDGQASGWRGVERGVDTHMSLGPWPPDVRDS